MQLSNVVQPIYTFQKAGFYTGKAERAKSKVKGKEDNDCEHQNMFALVFIWI